MLSLIVANDQASGCPCQQFNRRPLRCLAGAVRLPAVTVGGFRLVRVAIACLAAASCTSSSDHAALAPAPSSVRLPSSTSAPAATPKASAKSGWTASATPTPGEALVVQRASRPMQFESPSHNIRCMVGEDALCKSYRHRWHAPARPDRCDPLAYGDTLVLVRSGRISEFLCQGDNTFFGATPVLAYGHAWRYGHTQCLSAGDGVTCTNLVTRHGFFTNLDAYRLF